MRVSGAVRAVAGLGLASGSLTAAAFAVHARHFPEAALLALVGAVAAGVAGFWIGVVHHDRQTLRFIRKRWGL